MLSALGILVPGVCLENTLVTRNPSLDTHTPCATSTASDRQTKHKSVVCCAEVLQYTGLSTFSEARWQYVGYAKLQGEDLNYFGIPGLRIAGNQGVLIIAVCQVGFTTGDCENHSFRLENIKDLTISMLSVTGSSCHRCM